MTEPLVGTPVYPAANADTVSRSSPTTDAGHNARPTTPAISVEHLSFRYADTERWVLRDASLTVPGGETTLILGPSGCGKSTLALCLSGLIPDLIEGEMQGKVRVWGQPAGTLWKGSPFPPTASAAGHSPQALSIGSSGAFVGEVFQDPETQMVMPRVDEEIAFGLEGMGVPAADMPGRISAALALVGLQGRPRAWVDTLSGGQKQRLALAAVLAMQPGILVLDEPTAFLDPLTTSSFFETLRRLKADLGITIILIEHRLDAVLPLVDHIVAMNRQGHVIIEGTPSAVLNGHMEELDREGMWLPMTCRLMQALQAHGLPSPAALPPTLGEGSMGCPPTMVEVEAGLRATFGATVPRDGTDSTQTPNVSKTTAVREPAVSIENLTFSYPDSSPALRDVTMQIRRGRFFAIVGANGSGKTTLARHLVGLLRPGSGTVTVLGQDTRRRSPAELARQVGYVFQNPEHQFVAGRVADELAYSLRGRFDDAQVAKRVQSLLRTFDLEGYEGENPFALSQGQKRRLSVATMVALEQPILILDEPTFGQDQQSTTSLMATLRRLHESGETIIFITHDMQLVAEYADEVAVMNNGALIFQGGPHDLFGKPGILLQASLALPPLAELSNHLGLPMLLTMEEWVKWAQQHPATSS